MDNFEPVSNEVGLEGIAVIGLLLFAGIVFFAVHFGTRRGNGANAEHPVEYDLKPPTQIFSAGRSERQPARFDAAHARQVPARKVVQGNAWVTDGDTIVIDKTQIRLFGIDAPELDHPYGKMAKWALVRLCKGQTVRADILEVDVHGRAVARCFLPDGRDLSAEMVTQGLAIDWPKFSGGIYRTLEIPDARKKLWLADARQKGRMHVWDQFEARKGDRG